VGGVEGSLDQRHAREGALGEEAAGIVDNQETTVTDQAEGVERRGGDGDTG
jgi:hypothetical protein